MKQIYTLLPRSYGFFFLFVFSPLLLLAQNKRPLEHSDVQRWRRIEQARLSNDGQWVAYTLAPATEGDPSICLWDARQQSTSTFARATDAKFTEDSKYLIFKIKPALDTLKALRRRKVKDDDLPKDTLGILSLSNGKLEKIPRIKNISVPEKWSGWIAYQIEGAKAAPAKKDTTASPSNSTPNASEKPPKKSKKPKKEDKDNGYRLIVRNTATGRQDTFAYVQNFSLAKRQPRILFSTSGIGDTLGFPAASTGRKQGVYWWDAEKNMLHTLQRGKGKYQQLSLDDNGTQAAYLADTDTTKARIRPLELCYWGGDLRDSAQSIANAQSKFLTAFNPQAPTGQGWTLSENARPVFSEDGSKLYFGIAPPPVLNDTTLLPEEIVNVEVWVWTDGHLYTEQEVRLDNEKKRSYPVVWHTRKNRFVPLGSPEVPELRFTEPRDHSLALGFTEEPYAHYLSSEGAAHKDLYAVDLISGDKKMIIKDLRCNPRISPASKYIAWWSDPDTAWFAWNARTAATLRLTDNQTVPFYNEETDVPDYPNEHGLAGWLPNDEAVILYDRYDLWKIDPEGKKKPERLTKGRETETTYRYLRLDPDARDLDPAKPALLHTFNQRTKAEGYALLNWKTGALSTWLSGDFACSRQPVKAKNAERLLFTQENFQTFPDLLYAPLPNPLQPETLRSSQPQRVSNANPQQSEYRWGAIELIHWTSLSGEKLDGLLVKPADFDPAKQYPMLVNFYEKNSDGLHTHRAPDFHRSQINFTYYASRGYLVFSPDIPYRTGYPGECAYDAIVSGVSSLIDRGFVDAKRVALQGHSWGGYQAAYLVTRTNMFKCAEAGAPVANMTSAYGGIRWESGLSRAFQYEHQQSRIGGTLWERPKQYLENSPLFALDKVQTPLLILHNDKDGAVPWYQGIELFTGLRRLGKPAWMLNYNDEPHWPVKLQNRTDFQLRMQQFFDHYLMGKPMPGWMLRGVPPMEKGILQGLD